MGIEQGIKELFESERYRQYLSTTNRFHLYSVINTSNFLTEHNLLDYALLKKKLQRPRLTTMSYQQELRQ